MNPAELNTRNKLTWCPGCGNFGLFEALKKAIVSLKLSPEEVLVTYGIGCHGHMLNFMATNGFQGLHGRPLPLATGAKIANHKLAVLVSSGDGDAYGEGLAHLLAAAKANHDLTLLVHNNWAYSLTTGQASPTTPQGKKTKSSPLGTTETPLNPLALSLIAGATFVARGFALEIDHLANLISQAITHKGFAHIDILQPCVIFNPEYSIAWFKERIYQLPSDQKKDDYEQALKQVHETEKFPIGVFYQIKKPSYEELLPQLKESSLVSQKPKANDIQNLLKNI